MEGAIPGLLKGNFDEIYFAAQLSAVRERLGSVQGSWPTLVLNIVSKCFGGLC